MQLALQADGLRSVQERIMGQVNVNPPPESRGGMGCGFLAGLGTGLTLVVLLVVLVLVAVAVYLVYSLLYGGLNVNVNLPS